MATNETRNVDEIRQKQSRGEQLTPEEQQLLTDDENRQKNNKQTQDNGQSQK